MKFAACVLLGKQILRNIGHVVSSDLHEVADLSMNSQVRGWCTSASLARARRSKSWSVSGRDASEKIFGTSESHFVLAVASDLKRHTMVRAFKRSAWSLSTSSRFSNFLEIPPWPRTRRSPQELRATADSTYRTLQRYPRDAPPRDNCTPSSYARPPSKRSVVPTLRTARSPGRGPPLS